MEENRIYNANRQLRKVKKNKDIFLNDFSLVESMYPANAETSLK